MIEDILAQMPPLPEGVTQDRVVSASCGRDVTIDVIERVTPQYDGYRRVTPCYVPASHERMVTYSDGAAFVYSVPTTRTVKYRLTDGAWLPLA